MGYAERTTLILDLEITSGLNFVPILFHLSLNKKFSGHYIIDRIHLNEDWTVEDTFANMHFASDFLRSALKCGATKAITGFMCLGSLLRSSSLL